MSKPKALPIHPLANRLPAMSPAEYEALKASIRDNKQIDPIVLLDGKILDGRHRDRVCRELGVEPKTVDFKPSWGDPVEYVIAKANHRNMTDGQKCWAAAQFVDDLAKTSKPGPKDGGKFATNSGKSRDVAALRFGVSARAVQDARVLMKSAPKLFERLGADQSYNVNRAMQEWRKETRQRETRKAAKAATVDLGGLTLLHGDVLECLATVASNSVRCVFTDPPYNIGKAYHGDAHGDARSDAAFLDWCAKWIEECVRVLTPDGSLFLMINGLYAGRVEMALRAAGLHRRNTIYWWENNPENQTGNFSDAVRPIHYFTRSRDAFIFNDTVRVPSRRNEIGDKRGISAGKLPDNVWIEGRIPGNSLERVPFADAPPQLPVSIPETCVLVASEPGDTILDPFNGNGTTAIAALRNGRKYVGIDQSKKYLDQSRRWVAAQLAATGGPTDAKTKH